MQTIQYINYNDLPHLEGSFSKLYRDYINDFQKVQRFFEIDYRNLESIKIYAQCLQQRFTNRTLLVNILLEQNKQFGVSETSIANIGTLLNDGTFAVVTGQQVGILTGPLYTIYKVATAIKLAKELNIILPEYKFVPVFWLEGEDHDIDEVTKIGLINSNQELTIVEYMISGKKAKKNHGPVGELVFDANLTDFLSELHNTLGNTEFKPQLFDLIQRTYKPNTTFNHSFVALMNKFFEDEGLIFISSNDKGFKQVLSPIFINELTEYPHISQLIIEQSAELEENYHAQIKTKALNLYYFYNNGRYLIEPRENDFTLKGTRKFITRNEMLRTASEHPELLSPNVALRPICQDILLPTIAYVAGPSEIAYFAQLKKVYQYFDMTMPMIYPRASVTLIEDKFERIMEKYQLTIFDLFGEHDRIKRKVIELLSEINIDEMFDETSKRINDQLNEMKFGISYIDTTLLGALENTRNKIEHSISLLKSKVTEAQIKKHEIALRQIAKVINVVFPKKNFQERELNVMHFLNKHGLDFVNNLQNEIQIDQFKHQIIRV